MKKYINSKSKYGKNFFREVDSLAKIKTLSIIHNNYFYEKFTFEDFLNSSLSHEKSDKDKINRERQRLLRARRQNWIRKNKDGFFEVTNKFKNYVLKWGSPSNSSAPLYRKWQPQVVEKIIEKRIPITKKYTERVIGEK